MKTVYPKYIKGLGTSQIEAKLSDEDKVILEDFLNYVLTNASLDRVKKVKTYMLQFIDIIEKPYNQWTIKDIQGYVILLNQTKRTEWTKNDVKKILRRFLKYHYKKHEDLESMLSLIKCKSDREAFNSRKINESTIINESEFEKVLIKASSLKQKALLSLMFEAALRPHEAINLRWKDVKLNDDVGSISVYCGKTSQVRTIPIQSSVIHLKRYRQAYEFIDCTDNDYVFPNPKDRSKAIPYHTLNAGLRKISKLSGINKNVFPYLLRHSRITEINKKLPAHLESRFAGHTIEQSQMYTHLSSDDLRNAMIEKVFNVKEITPEKKHQLEEEIEQIKKQNNMLIEEIKLIKHLISFNAGPVKA